jgi:Fur family transcriptional regulator, peroxide stress response regulator
MHLQAGTLRVKYKIVREKAVKLEKLIKKSKDKGLKLTPQRMIIFNIIAEGNRHITADEIYQMAKAEYPMLSPATVYRNMEQLVEAGLLTHLDLGGPSTRYDTNLEEHHHFVCEKCGKITDLYLKDIRYVLDPDKSNLSEVRISSPQLYLHGTCGECS